jgi:hypothetical protein
VTCHCGCGGEPREGKRFIHGHHSRVLWRDPQWSTQAARALVQRNIDRTQSKRVRWSRGRAFVYRPSHPAATRGGCIPRARAVVEDTLGRILAEEEVVHHINIDRSDDHSDNLYVFTNQSEHMTFHERVKRLGIRRHFRDWFSKSEREMAR